MWDQRYAEFGFAYGQEPNDFLAEVASMIPSGGKVLSLAEGEGRNAVYLAQKGFQVMGVDGSSVGLDKAQQFATASNVNIETVCTDLADYQIEENVWDGIVSIWGHFPPALRKMVHLQVVKGLKMGGVFILESYTPHHYDLPGVGGPPPGNEGMMMRLELLKKELAPLEVVVGHEIEREVQEGKYHQGLSGVVQFVAIKK